MITLSFSFLSLNTVTVDAVEPDPSVTTEQPMATEYPAINEINLYVETYNHPLGAEIDLVIYTSLSNEIIDISFSGDGFALADDFSVLNNEIRFSAIHIESSLMPQFSISLTLNNDEILNCKLFGIVRENQLFIAAYGYYFAEEAYRLYSLSNDQGNELHELNVEAIVDIPNNQHHSIAVTTSVNNTCNTKVSGKILWKESNSNTNHPLVNCRVILYKSNTFIKMQLDQTLTNQDGSFEFNFDYNVNENETLSIEVFAGGDDIQVYNTFGFEYVEVVSNNEIQSISLGNNTLSDIIFDMGTDANPNFFARALQVAQAAVYASMYYEKMKGSDVENVTVYYPHPVENVGCRYFSEIATICITGQEYVGEIKPHQAWDVIMHEYGHHVEHNEGIVDAIEWGHVATISMAEHYKDHIDQNDPNCSFYCAQFMTAIGIPLSECKLEGSNLSWAEGWATLFAIQAQEYYGLDSLDINHIGDKRYTSYNGVDISIEHSYSPATANVEDNELTVQRILYDIYDSSELESSDHLAIGHHGMWNSIMQSGAKNLYEFIEYYKADYSGKSQLTYLGEILAYHKLTAEAPTIPSLAIESPIVTFTWEEPNGNGYYRARKFQVNFYNENYDLIGSTTPQALTPSSNDNFTVTIDSALWNTLVTYPTCLYVSVTVYECDGDVNNTSTNHFITSYESAYSFYLSSSHVHNYNHSYEHYNEIKHKAYCICGSCVHQNHNFISGSLFSTCESCGYITADLIPSIKL